MYISCSKVIWNSFSWTGGTWLLRNPLPHYHHLITPHHPNPHPPPPKKRKKEKRKRKKIWSRFVLLHIHLVNWKIIKIQRFCTWSWWSIFCNKSIGLKIQKIEVSLYWFPFPIFISEQNLNTLTRWVLLQRNLWWSLYYMTHLLKVLSCFLFTTAISDLSDMHKTEKLKSLLYMLINHNAVVSVSISTYHLMNYFIFK